MRAIAVAVVLVTIGLAGCTGEVERPGHSATPGPGVVSHAGLAGIRFGDSRAELRRVHGLVQDPGDCAPRLPAHPRASPVFEDGRLVLLWVDPPLHTPAGIAVGSPVAAVRAAHPAAEQLAAPPDSFRFDGLLATVDDRAYLFLHDRDRVQKVIVGFAEHARRLFADGFGTC